MINPDEQIRALVDGISADWWHDGQVDYEGGKEEIERVNRAIKHLVADYIESIELPIKLQEHDPRVDARDVYNYAFNEAVNLCQAKLDEAIKALKENK